MTEELQGLRGAQKEIGRELRHEPKGTLNPKPLLSETTSFVHVRFSKLRPRSARLLAYSLSSSKGGCTGEYIGYRGVLQGLLRGILDV